MTARLLRLCDRCPSRVRHLTIMCSLFAVNLLHPFVHGLEAGMLDPLIGGLNALAASSNPDD